MSLWCALIRNHTGGNSVACSSAPFPNPMGSRQSLGSLKVPSPRHTGGGRHTRILESVVPHYFWNEGALLHGHG